MAEYGYKRAGMEMLTNSAAAYGSVMHHAVGAFHRDLAEGMDWASAKQKMLDNFLHYWQ